MYGFKLMILGWVLLWGCGSESVKQEEIRPGEIWEDQDGKHVNAHGGGMIFHEGRYYWFGEAKDEKTSAALVGVNCYSSADLYHWRKEGVALRVVDEPGHPLERECTIERPKVIYNPETRQFVMWFHLELKGQGYGAAYAAVAVSDKVAGPYRFVNAGRVCAGSWPENMPQEYRHAVDTAEMKYPWWTPQWRQCVEEGMFVRRDFEGGQMSRDMTLFVDDDGKAYHIYSSEENLTIQIAELSADFLTHTGRYIRIFPGGHNEAPAIFKRNGKYWMITSGCTGWDPNAARLSVAENIWGPWEMLPNPCVGEEAELTFRSQSTFIQKVEGMEDAWIFMADRWTPSCPSDGRYIWLPILFDNDRPYLKWFDSWNLDVFKAPSLPSRQEVVAVMERANDYWRKNHPQPGWAFWHVAAYHTGNMAAYSLTKNERYKAYSEAWAEHNEWKGAKSEDPSQWKYQYGETDEHVLFGDWQICFQTYIDLYRLDPDPKKIARAKEVMEYQMGTPRDDYWWWADGLYMVMPVMTKLYNVTGNPLYLEKLHEYLAYADRIMYDKEESLYYRDGKYIFPQHKTVNGKKDFWARGDGWVFAGFAKVLADLPADDKYRDAYVRRFQEMAEAIAGSQQDEGYWTRSLLDPEHAPGRETSGTAFFAYGLFWGINQGLLEAGKYLPVATKAWNYLATVALQKDGKIGYVQPIGEKAIPGQVVDANSTADFGVGAFLLAACELARYLETH